jgi:hypothetical protein
MGQINPKENTRCTVHLSHQWPARPTSRPIQLKQGAPILRVQGGASGGPAGSGCRRRGPVEGDCEENERGTPDLFEAVAASETHRERPAAVAAARLLGTAALARAGGRGCRLRGRRSTWR